MKQLLANWWSARRDYLATDWNRNDPSEFARRWSAMQQASIELEKVAELCWKEVSR